jgi:hypothetical protein
VWCPNDVDHVAVDARWIVRVGAALLPALGVGDEAVILPPSMQVTALDASRTKNW